MQEPKKLTRDTDNKVIAGVCSGIANYFELDPVLVRIIAVIFALTFGGGVLAYLLGWVIIPEKKSLQS